MKFGLSFLPDANGKELSAESYYRTALNLVKLADNAGMSTIKMTEHYLHPYGGFCPDPTVFLAAVASCTKQIRLMTGCILPAFHHPIKIAAKTAMLDALSGGRLEVGFARAYLPHEFQAFNVNMDDSRDLFEKTIQAVIKLWTEENVTMNTPYFDLLNATSFPKPVQQKHPPVWGAAVMARQSFAWLGEQGFNLLVTPPLDGLFFLKNKINIYLESFYAAHPNKKPRVTLSMPLLIAEQSQQAIKLSNQFLDHYVQVWGSATANWQHQSSKDYPGYHNLANILQANTPEKMRQDWQALVGSPTQIIDAISQIQELFDIEQIIWQIDFGAQPEQISMQTLTLFIEQVMPYIDLKQGKPAYVHASN